MEQTSQTNEAHSQPLAWWEELQLSMLEYATVRLAPEMMGVIDFHRLRAHPSEWRQLRERFKEVAKSASTKSS